MLNGKEIKIKNQKIAEWMAKTKIDFGEKLVIIILGIAILSDVICPKVAFAGSNSTENCAAAPHRIYCYTENVPVSFPSLGVSADAKIKVFYVTVTAYSSTRSQTDSTPFVTAMGTRVRDGIVAANFLPFGAKVRIPGEFGDKLFVVEDRMNRRFSNRMDVWMPDHDAATRFGVRILKVEVYE